MADENNNNKADDGSSEEVAIDYSKLDPTKIPADIVQKTTAFSGLLRDHQDTKQDLRSVREKDDVQPQVDEEIDPLESLKDVEDGEPVSAGEIKKIVAAQEAKAKKTEEKAIGERKKTETKDAQEAQRIVRAESERRLKAKYTPETHPGLDGATVIAIGATWLKNNRPALFQSIYHGSDDPCQDIYDTAISLCPELKKVAATKSSEQLLESINRGGIPKSGAGVDGEHDFGDLNKMLEMDEDTLLALAEKEDLSA